MSKEAIKARIDELLEQVGKLGNEIIEEREKLLKLEPGNGYRPFFFMSEINHPVNGAGINIVSSGTGEQNIDMFRACLGQRDTGTAILMAVAETVAYRFSQTLFRPNIDGLMGAIVASMGKKNNVGDETREDETGADKKAAG